MLTYIKHFVQELRDTEAFSYQLKTEEEKVEGEAVILGICNGQRLGTNIPLNLAGNPWLQGTENKNPQ